jgi:hypothetical protein
MKRIISLVAIFCMLLLPLTLFSRDGWGGRVGEMLGGIPRVQMITIHGKRSGDVMKDMHLTPFNKIFLDRYTRVKWTNNSDTPIRIKFGKGENCQDISRRFERTDYWLDKCHITKEPIAPKGILEIVFNEGHPYDYEIQFVGTTSTFKGSLVVH